MKKIMTGITLAALFTVPQQVRADYKDREMSQEEIGAIAMGGTALFGAAVGIASFAKWLNQPTSKNLFAIANELEKKIDQVNLDIEKINNNQEATGVFNNIQALMYEIVKLTQQTFATDSTFKRLLQEDSPLLKPIKNRDFITVSKDKKTISVQFDIEKINTTIKDIRDAAKKKKVQEDSAWYKRAWRYMRGQKNTQD